MFQDDLPLKVFLVLYEIWSRTDKEKPSMKHILYGLGFIPQVDDKMSVMNINTNNLSEIDIKSIKDIYSLDSKNSTTIPTIITIPTVTPSNNAETFEKFNPVKDVFFWVIVVVIVIFWLVVGRFAYLFYKRVLEKKKEVSS